VRRAYGSATDIARRHGVGCGARRPTRRYGCVSREALARARRLGPIAVTRGGTNDKEARLELRPDGTRARRRGDRAREAVSRARGTRHDVAAIETISSGQTHQAIFVVGVRCAGRRCRGEWLRKLLTGRVRCYPQAATCARTCTPKARDERFVSPSKESQCRKSGNGKLTVYRPETDSAPPVCT
jgi:hypothetical protein